MKVLSLFDGMSCARLALERLCVTKLEYYASEIDSHGITATQANFPDTIQLGNVELIGKHLPELNDVHLLVGGSPCQGFSVNGKKLNFDDERSKLLFEFIRVRDELKPKYWLLENVATMRSDIKLMIDNYVGVEGKLINSNAFVPQNRKRLYWTNIPFKMPVGLSGLCIEDILESWNPETYLLSSAKVAAQKLAPTTVSGVTTLNPRKPNGKQTYQQDRIYNSSGRFPALTATLGNRFNIKRLNNIYRRLTIREQARLQHIPDSYDFDCLSDSQASKLIGNGMTVSVIAHILWFMKST
jgi:site-specific DNA-cytosine methylase